MRIKDKEVIEKMIKVSEEMSKLQHTIGKFATARYWEGKTAGMQLVIDILERKPKVKTEPKQGNLNIKD